MNRTVLRMICFVLIITLAAPLGTLADPSGGFVKIIFSLVPKVTHRRNAYRAADNWLNKETMNNFANLKTINEHQFKMNVNDYNNRFMLLDRQDRDVRALHQKLKKHAHDDFNRYVRSEAINLVFANLSRSASFKKKLGRFNSVIKNANTELSDVLAKIGKAEKLFWPDKLKRAHDTVKASRKMLKTLDLIGASPARLKQMLETLDKRLDKLKDRTEPKTLVQIRKELTAAKGEIDAIARKTATIAEKVSKTQALVVYVSKSALKDPKVQKLIADISKREGEIMAAYARKAYGPETMERLKELGIDPNRGDIEQIRKAYVQKLIALKKSRKNLTESDLDKLWLESAREVTPVEDYAKADALIKASKTKGVKPLEVSFSYAGEKQEGLKYKWDIDDTVASREDSFSYIFKEVNEFTVTLRVTTKRGVSSTAKKKITVTDPVTLAVKVSASPEEVGRGGTVIVTVTPEVKGVTQGKLDITMSVDGKTFHSVSLNEGELGYDKTAKYPIAKNAPYGEKTVLVKAVLALDEVMTKAYGKPKIAAEGKAVFEIKEGVENSDLFIGTWSCVGKFQSHSSLTAEDLAGLPKTSPFKLIVNKKEDEFFAQIPGASKKHSSKLETKYRIDSVSAKGNSMKIQSEEVEWVTADGVRSVYQKSKHFFELRVSNNGGKISGTLESDMYAGSGSDYDTQFNTVSCTRSK